MRRDKTVYIKGEIILKILDILPHPIDEEFELVLEKHKLGKISRTDWYFQSLLLNVMNDLVDEFGEKVLVYLGKKIVNEINYFPYNTIDEAIISINKSFKYVHKNAEFDLKTMHKTNSEYRILFKSNYNSHLMYGILLALFRKFKRNINIIFNENIYIITF